MPRNPQLPLAGLAAACLVPLLALAFAFALALAFTLALSPQAALAKPGPDFRFAFVGDRTGGATPGVWESVISQVEMFHPDFVVSVGDHIEGYTEDPAELDRQWTGIEQILGGLSMPFYPCPGNHDITTDGMLPAWTARTHRDPCYSFDHEGVHFLVLDTSRWESSEEWMRDSGYVDWLRADLEKHRKARLTVVVCHKPYWFNTLAEGREDLMHRIFREFGVDYVFNGHFHNYGTATYDGIRYTILGSSGGDFGTVDEDRGLFFQYAWCAVRGDSLDWQVVRADKVFPERAVDVAGLKLIERIPTLYVNAGTFSLPDAAQQGPGTCPVSIRNITAEPWMAQLRWEPAPGWTVTPASSELPLAPDLGVTLPIQAERTGSFYPLPRLRVDYPYKPGKVYKYDAPLPVLRTQVALHLGAAAAAPVIDGKLDDACWQRANPATEFGDPDGNACTIEPTAIYFARDEANLYVAARCTQADGPPLVRAAERDAAAYRDDCVGFFLSNDGAQKTVYQVYFNAGGTVFDQRLTVEGPGQYGGDRAKWNGEYTVAVDRGPGEWSLEAVIPFATIGVTRAPAAGDRWRVNFRRKEMSRGSSADWQIPIDYDPARFGYLLFTE